MKTFKPSSRSKRCVTASSGHGVHDVPEQQVHEDLVRNLSYYWSPEYDELQEYTSALVENLQPDELVKVFKFAASYFDSESLWNIVMSRVPKEDGGDMSFSEYISDEYGN